jgi:CSLREA domain-containing protein
VVNRNRRFALAAIALTFIFVAMPELARAATITVQSALDDTNPGHCTLREAINSANLASSGTGTCTAGSGTDTIEFSFVTAVTINLGSTLPAIANTLTITGAISDHGGRRLPRLQWLGRRHL